MLNAYCMLELHSLVEQAKISPNAKALLLCGQLSLDTIPQRLAEAGLLHLLLLLSYYIISLLFLLLMS